MRTLNAAFFIIICFRGIILAQDDSSMTKLISTYTTPGSTNAVYVSGTYAYVADGSNGLLVLDISKREEPVEVGSYYTGSMALDVCVSGSSAFVANSHELLVIDVSSPVNLKEVGVCNTQASRVHIQDSFVYVSANAWDNGFKIIDVSKPHEPLELGSCKDVSWATDVYAVDSYAYVTSSYIDQGGFQVIDISIPSNPKEEGFYSSPSEPMGVCVSGKYAYIANHDFGLRILDLSRPEKPVEIGYCSVIGEADAVCVSSTYAYLVGDALTIVNISTPTNPQVVDRYEISGHSECVFVDDPYLYVADREAGLMIFKNFLVESTAEGPEVGRCTMRLSASRSQLAYDLPGEGKLVLYSVDGRRVLSRKVSGKGTWAADRAALPRGVYVASLETEELEVRTKLVVIQ